MTLQAIQSLSGPLEMAHDQKKHTQKGCLCTGQLRQGQLTQSDLKVDLLASKTVAI